MNRPVRAGRGLLVLCVAALPLLVACDGNEAAVEEPELISVDLPFRYPVELWDEGLEGETVIMVRVTEMGAVDSVYVLEGSGQAAFDSAAVTGAKDLRFAPGRKDDRRVVMWTKLPVRFHRNDGPPAGEPSGAHTGATP
jgi:TonB family protein